MLSHAFLFSRDCKENKGAFEAFQLSSQFDINDILNYSKVREASMSYYQSTVVFNVIK